MNIKNKQTYFNLQSILFGEQHYDFIIGEHLKGRKYAIKQRKKLINQTKEEDNVKKKSARIL